MLKNYLKATKGDIFNAIMASAAFNLRLKLNEIKALGIFWLKLIQSIIQNTSTYGLDTVILIPKFTF